MTLEEYNTLKKGDILIRTVNLYDYTKDKEYLVILTGEGLCTRDDKGFTNKLNGAGKSYERFIIKQKEKNSININNSNYDTTKITEGKIYKIDRLIPTISTGVRPTGNVSRGRIGKTAITVGHLSYKTIIG